MSRKFTAALFENVDYQAQAAEMAKKQKAKEREKQKRQQQQNSSSIGLFSRWFSRQSSPKAIDSQESSSSSNKPLRYPRVILFGDSLTQYSFSHEGGWGTMLADKLQRKADVVVRGYSGYNTRWCRIILDQVRRLFVSVGVSVTYVLRFFFRCSRQ